MPNFTSHALIIFFLLYSVIVPFASTDARASLKVDYDEPGPLTYKRNPAPDKHRCGICPTYFQKICAFDHLSNSTYIFDNHCIMDLYNCMEDTEFAPIKYEHCLFFGNFAYVYGYKYEDMDYGEDHIIVKNSKKNPDFIRRFSGLAENIFDFSD